MNLQVSIGTSVVAPNSQRDGCGQCVGTSNRNDPRWDATRDCAGVCFGSARVDSCGICAGGNSGRVPNADMGCDEVCFSGVQTCGKPAHEFFKAWLALAFLLLTCWRCPHIQSLTDPCLRAGMLYWGPVIITSSGALCGLLIIICILILRARLRQRRQEFDLRMRATRVTSAVRASRAYQFRQRTEQILEELTEFEFDEKNTEVSFSNTTCSICLGEFETGMIMPEFQCVMVLISYTAIGDLLRRLTCNHSFHSDCIASWLAVKHTCPLCVAPVTTTAPTPDPPSARRGHRRRDQRRNTESIEQNTEVVLAAMASAVRILSSASAKSSLKRCDGLSTAGTLGTGCLSDPTCVARV